MLSDSRLVYELEREVRHTYQDENMVVLAYTLRLVFDRLAKAEGRTTGVEPIEQYVSFDN